MENENIKASFIVIDKMMSEANDVVNTVKMSEIVHDSSGPWIGEKKYKSSCSRVCFDFLPFSV